VNALPKEDGAAQAELSSMTLMEHLRELRSRIVKCLVAVALGTMVMWFVYPTAFDFLLDTLKSVCATDQDCQIVASSPLQPLSARVTFSGYGGIALAMPVLLWQLWQFVTPGLYPKERRLALPFVLSSVLLFALGAGVALWTLPRALDFLVSIGGDSFAQFYQPDAYFSFTVKMMLAFGIGFEFPIALIFLQLIGLVSPGRLSMLRRYAIVAIVALVAVLTPSGDPISLAALAVPMVVFYEVSILIGRLHLRRQQRRGRARTAS
jgi:sec-independent protein translocase protein TatC